MKRIGLVAIVVLLARGPVARAGAELTLQDGTLLSGTTVERTREGVYLLTQKDGEVVTIPVELVKKLHLTSDDDPAATGIKQAESETLVGPPVEPPKTREQLGAFGRPPAPFSQGPVDTRWVPQSALGPDVTNFNPARWFRAPVDTTWTPTSAFRQSTDVTQFSPVRWYRAPTDPIWRPTNGFRPATQWFSSESER